MTADKRPPHGSQVPHGSSLSFESQDSNRATDLRVEHWPISDRTRLSYAVVVLPDGADADPLGLIAAGARAVIADEAELGAARAAVLAGGSYLSPAVLARLAPSEPVETVRLAPREVAALHCIVAGLTHREAARELGVTEQSFNTYAKRLRRKLGATNKAELTRRAAELGYVPM